MYAIYSSIEAINKQRDLHNRNNLKRLPINELEQLTWIILEPNDLRKIIICGVHSTIQVHFSK